MALKGKEELSSRRGSPLAISPRDENAFTFLNRDDSLALLLSLTLYPFRALDFDKGAMKSHTMGAWGEAATTLLEYLLCRPNKIAVV